MGTRLAGRCYNGKKWFMGNTVSALVMMMMYSDDRTRLTLALEAQVHTPIR